MPIYLLQIENYWSQGNPQWFDIGRATLAELGIRLPAGNFTAALLGELCPVKLAMGWQKPADLFRRPTLTDPDKQAAMQVLTRVLVASTNGLPDLYPVVALRMVRLSLHYGNSPFAGVAYGVYGVLMVMAGLGRVADMYTLGQAGIAFTDRPDMHAGGFLQWLGYALFIAHYKEPLRTCCAHGQRAMTLCLEAGELTSYGYAAYAMLNYRMLNGIPLSEILDEFDHLMLAMKKFRLTQLEVNLSVWWQLAMTLTGAGTIPWKLAGPQWHEMNDFPNDPLHEKTLNLADHTYDYLFARLWIACLTEDWGTGLRYARKLEASRTALKVTENMNVSDFFYGICAAAQATADHGRERRRLLRRLRHSCRQLRTLA